MKNDSKIICLLVLVGSFLLVWNLGHYYLWGDEGVTALYGKNILKFGLPYGFDGHNLHQTKNGLYLNNNLLPHLDGWLQYYTAALSMAIFGKSTFGARALFVIIAIGSLLVQYLFVLEYFRNRRLALFTLFLTVTSVSFLLFARQCRYYSLVMFLVPAICLLYSRFGGKWWEYLLAGACFILLSLSNYILAFASLTGMAIAFFVFDSRAKAAKFFLIPLPLLGLVMGGFLWWLYSPGTPHHPNVLKNLNPSEFIRIFWLYLKDINSTQLLPLGALITLSFFWVRKIYAKEPFRVNREISIFAFALIFLFLISVLSPQMSQAAHSDIRYATPIFPFLFLFQAMVLEEVMNWRRWAAGALAVAVIFTNVLTFTPFKSYFCAYAKENLQPFPNSVKTAVLFLEDNAKKGDAVLVSPNHMLGPLEFYLGDRLRFCGVIAEDSPALKNVKARLPEYVYSQDVVPDWVVKFGLETDLMHVHDYLYKLRSNKFTGYVFSILGPDVSRPELFWRSFSKVERYDPNWSLMILAARSAPKIAMENEIP